ncbi:MAG: choice-of-anchor D domain-containing protein, partial [bacterium]
FAIQGTGISPEMDVQGNGITIPDGDTSPDLSDNTDYGYTAVAGEVISHTFTIKNSGYADLILTASPRVTITGEHKSDFSVTSQPDSLVAAEGGTTNFTVQFDPSESGTRIATINIFNNDNQKNPYDFIIQGTGTTPEIDVQGNSTSINNGDFSPHPADGTDFGYLTVFSDTVFHTFTIKNTGYADLILTGSPRVEITGEHPADFTITSHPDSIIAGGGSTTTFTVQFYPLNIGTRTAELNIANTDPDESPYIFTIQGTGTTPEIDIQGNSISIPDGSTSTEQENNTDFGNINVSNDSASHTFTIVNTGNGKLILKNSPEIEISGTHQSDFTVTSRPDSIIKAGKTSNFTVQFKPSGSGTRVARLNIINNDMDENPYDFTIQGTGISNEPEIDILGNGISISDDDYSPSINDDTDFGDCNVASGTISHTFTIKNYGNADLNLTGTDDYVVISGSNASDFSVTSQPTSPVSSGGGNTSFTIEFDPSATGYRSAIVTIENDDIDENSYKFAILGTGVVVVSEQDSLALVALYESTNGEDEWINDHYWKQGPIRNWYGVTVNYGVVTALQLNNNNLVGTLPPEIKNLSNLSKLDLQGNQLTGSLLKELGDLSNLDTLYLNNNQLNDTLPAELGDLTNLKHMYINNNQLTGTIPSEFGNLTKLIKLDLHNNKLSGSIPPELHNLSELNFLSLKNNQITGTIPAELGNLSNLEYFAFNGNQLTGPIPSSFTDLTALSNNKSDIRWNALYTDNETVRTFMNQKQKGGDWESTQTVAPESFTCGSSTDSSITLYWEPISYTKDLGGYNILYAETEGGPYTDFGITEDKTIDSLIVSGLSPEVSYYFVIKTQTNPHPDNSNTVVSDQSEEISCTTLQSQDSLALIALYNSTDGDNWTDNSNWLSQPIEEWYGVTVNNGYVTSLELNDNNLNGTIPSELEKLFKLEVIKLNSNQLTGTVPTSLTKLTNLLNNSSDFRWNGLYTDDNTLRTFINNKQKGNDWESTQTIAPENVSCGSATANSIKVTWTPISYTNDTGGYRVFYSTISDGPYTESGMTEDKTESSLVVTGLDPETKYYFMVKTQTNPHTNNNFTVISDESIKASNTTQAPTSLQSEDMESIPETFVLMQNRPNPFNPQTEITYALPKSDQVTITIYNMIGQPVRTLINSKMPAGFHTIIWNGCDNTGQPVPSGIYFYIMQCSSFKQIKKALLMK